MTDSITEKPVKRIQAVWEPQASRWANKDRHPLMAHSFIRKTAIKRELRQFDEELLKANRILDVGAGGGTHIYFPSELSPKVTAIDLSEAVLRLNPSAGKILADARSMFPFADNSFDVVVQFFLNRYLENQTKEMSEIARTLRPGGRFILMDHSRFEHQEEVAEFDPFKLSNTPSLIGFKGINIQELTPEIDKPEMYYYRGPLYLFTGVKP